MAACDLGQIIGKVKLFAGEDADALAQVLVGCEIRDFQPGQHICREGEYSEACGITLSGEIRVSVPMKGSRVDQGVVLKEGELFGEIAALSGTPRIADVVAVTPASILEMSRERLFDLLDRFPGVKRKVDDIYRERALAGLLMSVPVFSGIPDDFFKELIAAVNLKAYAPGSVVFRQDDRADSFYLIRYGFVKVHKKAGEREVVLAYLREGHYFGEVALLSDDERRSATVTAITRVEAAEIPKGLFERLLAAHPIVRRNLESVVERRMARDMERQDSVMQRSSALETSIDMGLIYGKAVLVIDTTLCVHCGICSDACAALHDGVSRLTRRGFVFDKFMLVPTSCRHCQDPTCMSQCPTGAITRDVGGEIYHKDSCIGCGRCAANCPWGNISIVTLPNGGDDDGPLDRLMRLIGKRTALPRAGAGRRRAVKCDMCRDYSFMGCVYNCPAGAAKRVDAADYFSDISSAG